MILSYSASFVKRAILKLASIASFSVLLTSVSFAQPSKPDNSNIGQRLDKLARTMNLDSFDKAIANGNQSAFSALPAKGYKNGFAEVLNKYQLIVIPRHSFTKCDEQMKVAGRTGEPGCVVSLKLGRIRTDGAIEDLGIRTEWVKGLEDKQFLPNNSAWATHITNGTGVFDANVAKH